MADVEPDSEKWRDRKLHVLQGSGTSGDSTAIYAVLVCTNAGKSPAWINETRAKFEIVETLPPTPNFESAEYVEASTIPLGMVEGGAAPHTQRLPWTPTAVGHEELGKMSVIYGFVRYRDIFKRLHVTTFGYRIIHGQLKRLENYPEYNQNTWVPRLRQLLEVEQRVVFVGVLISALFWVAIPGAPILFMGVCILNHREFDVLPPDSRDAFLRQAPFPPELGDVSPHFGRREFREHAGRGCTATLDASPHCALLGPVS